MEKIYRIERIEDPKHLFKVTKVEIYEMVKELGNKDFDAVQHIKFEKTLPEVNSYCRVTIKQELEKMRVQCERLECNMNKISNKSMYTKE